MLRTLLRPAVATFAALTILTGVIYPLLVTGIAQVAFPTQAAGSLIVKQGHAVGSHSIGQNFTDPKYFWGRPSATTPMPYNGIGSMGSNLGPLNPALIDAVKSRIAALHAADPSNTTAIPVDLVTASASGLDPDISVAAANYQVARIARARGMTKEAVQSLLTAHAQGRTFGFLGEPRVNVLEINLALDE